MKKLAAILLLVLFVFNTVGYRLCISFIQIKADEGFVARLDKGNYNDEDLITVKVPINLPYQTNWKEFERVDGEITVNGQVYKYVKRKIYNDTMILLCIQHEMKTKLEQKASDYFGKINDLPGNENGKKADALKQLLNDFDLDNSQQVVAITETTPEFNLHHDAFSPHHFIPLQGQPPEFLS